MSRIVRPRAGLRWGAPSRQRGLTLLSLVFLLAVVGLLGIGGFRLLPVYLVDLKVQGALKSVSEQFDGMSTSPAELRRALSKRFDIEMIEGLRARDIDIERGKGEYLLVATYDREVPYLGNVYLRVKFDHRVSIRFGE
jgi:hypothetical protein